MVEILSEQEEQEQDRWHQLLSQKSDNPSKTYADIRKGIEDAMNDPLPATDIEHHPRRDWLRA